MKPGKITPNEFEMALLERIADGEPGLRSGLGSLHVLSREYTGVGCFTRFRCDAAADAEEWQVGLDDLVIVPGVSAGLGAVLFCHGKLPDFLEVYTFGDELWDGNYDGFGFDAG